SETVAFKPAKFSREVPLIVKEVELSYYRISNQDSCVLSVIGPTTIKAFARLEFDPTMSADQKFRISVTEDGLEKQIFALRSKPSQIAEYKEISENIAGDAAQFFIEVPRGKHEYRFQIVDNGRSILLRFYLPRTDLSNNL
ncbi:MAG: hypothetical protein ABH878_06805, partial [bacterium]